MTGDYNKGWSAQSLGTHELAGDPPETSARFVIPVPRTRTATSHPDRQRHSIIDPVLKSHKAACGIEIRKTNEFAHGGKGVEDIEQSLDRLDRYFAAPTGR